MEYKLPQGLIVSCQAAEGEPLYKCGIMHLFARSAKAGGAVAIRALAGDIKAIKKETKLPVIGLIKTTYPDSSVYITPTIKEVKALIKTGCEFIAMDATFRPRPGGVILKELVDFIRNNAPGVQLFADASNIEEVRAAEELGFEYVSTTLRGYTEETKGIEIPDYKFIEECSKTLTRAKLVVEGGIWEKGQLEKVLEYKPYAVIIGTAITRPKDITARFKSCWEKN